MKYRKMQQSKFGLPVTATGSTQKVSKKYRSKLKHRQMHQCKSIYIGKIVISNQVKIGLKSESIATLPCELSNQERLVTIRL